MEVERAGPGRARAARARVAPTRAGRVAGAGRRRRVTTGALAVLAATTVLTDVPAAADVATGVRTGAPGTVTAPALVPAASPADADGHAHGRADSGALAESSRAVVDAADALADARAALATATARAAQARHDRHRAREDHVRAREAVAAARAAELATERRVASTLGEIAQDRADLSLLARAAYQRGRYAEWSAVLEADDPAELEARLAYVDVLGRTFEAHLGRLADDRDALAEQMRALADERDRRERAQSRARRSWDATRRHAEDAAAARAEIEATVAQREAALAAAEAARAEEERRRQSLASSSGALGARVRSLAAALGDHGRAAPAFLTAPTTGPVTSPYGPRLHPVLGYVKLHTGTDFGAGDGRVRAAAAGTVLLVASDAAYGNLTVVHHGWRGGRSVTTMYAHQAAVHVRPGQRVAGGQTIGVVGSTGYSTGPHLHLEVRLDGATTDPLPWLG